MLGDPCGMVAKTRAVGLLGASSCVSLLGTRTRDLLHENLVGIEASVTVVL
jgi:hypothetical protein